MGADRDLDGAPVLRAEVRRILGEKTPEESLGNANHSWFFVVILVGCQLFLVGFWFLSC